MILHATLGAKRFELLHELTPAADLIAVLVNPENRNAEIIIKDVQAAALTLGKKVQTVNVSSDRDLEMFFATPAQLRPAHFSSARIHFCRAAATNSLPGRPAKACLPCTINGNLWRLGA